MRSGEGINSYIGKEVVLHGEIAGTEDLFLDGRFEGTINLEDCRLTVGPNAHIDANVQARDVVVLGEVKGNIRATGRIELRHSCNVVGDIHSVHLMVEEGAAIVGRVELVQPVRPAVVPATRPAEVGLHAVYSESAERKEPQPETAEVAIAIASNG